MNNSQKKSEEVAYTIVMPRSLHTNLKTMCASEEVRIKDYLIALIELDLKEHILPANRIKK